MYPFHPEKTIIQRPALPMWSMVILLLLPFSLVNADTLSQRGIASWHEPGRGSHHTASHRPWVSAEMVAAHCTLPMGSKVRVTNLSNGRTAIVEITDRGPYGRGRIIDVSRRAAQALGLLTAGTALVRLDVVTDDDAS